LKSYEHLGVAGETWAVPVFLGNGLIVRDATGLATLHAR